MGFHTKLGHSNLHCNAKNFKYFSSLQQMENDAKIVDNDLEEYAKHLEI